METSLTIVALDLWPWQWSAGTSADSNRRNNASSEKGAAEGQRLLSRYGPILQTPRKQSLTHIAHSLRQCLSLAALACILRPTNILIWATLATVAWLRTSWSQRKVLVREVLLCGLVNIQICPILYNQLTFNYP